MSPDGCSLGGACLTRLLALGKIPVEPLNARLDKDSRSNWSKYRICSIALLYYTHFKLCCWQSFFASIIGGTCNFEKHCLFFAYLTTKFI